FGPSRASDVQLRRRIRQWQPQLRTLFLMRVVSLKYRLQLPGFELPENLLACLREYDERSAQMLEEMADEIEGKATRKVTGEESSELLRRVLQASSGPESRQLLAARVDSFDSFFTLLNSIDRVTASLAQAIGG